MKPVLVKSKAGHCPPGLAKKAVPCVPPGHVKRYRVGDYIYDGYVRIDNPSRYGLRRNGYYVRAGDYVYQVNRETHEVLNLIGAIADILN
ncbi:MULTISPECIES: excinuclease ABC subunit A [unclassified Ruegeria]|uniref:excinuclease ABC subunit A n=2 Tax=unclassified Ruegeria TaxID=2625375 RepID=UPI0020C4784B|nr:MULTISPECIES: excinuclease ABC subunit A [unclassified Ruegeria]